MISVFDLQSMKPWHHGGGGGGRSGYSLGLCSGASTDTVICL